MRQPFRWWQAEAARRAAQGHRGAPLRRPAACPLLAGPLLFLGFAHSVDARRRRFAGGYSYRGRDSLSWPHRDGLNWLHLDGLHGRLVTV